MATPSCQNSLGTRESTEASDFSARYEGITIAFFIPSLSIKPSLTLWSKANIRLTARRSGFRLEKFSLPDDVNSLAFWPFSHAKTDRTQQDAQISCQAFQGNVHRQGVAHPRRQAAFAPVQVGETEAKTSQIGAGSRFRRRPHKIESAVLLNGRSAGLPRASRITELVSPRIKTNNSRFQGARSIRRDTTCHVLRIRPPVGHGASGPSRLLRVIAVVGPSSSVTQKTRR